MVKLTFSVKAGIYEDISKSYNMKGRSNWEADKSNLESEEKNDTLILLQSVFNIYDYTNEYTFA